jgi:hypothetical protein
MIEEIFRTQETVLFEPFSSEFSLHQKCLVLPLIYTILKSTTKPHKSNVCGRCKKRKVSSQRRQPEAKHVDVIRQCSLFQMRGAATTKAQLTQVAETNRASLGQNLSRCLDETSMARSIPNEEYS